MVRFLGGDDQLHPGAGGKRGVSGQSCLDLVKASGLLRHGADLVHHTAVGISILFHIQWIALLHVIPDTLRRGEADDSVPLPRDHADLGVLSHSVVGLDIAELHHTGDGGLDLRVLQLCLVGKLRLPVLDLRGLHAVLILGKGLVRNAASAVHDLLPRQFLPGMTQIHPGGLQAVLRGFHLPGIDGADHITLCHHLSRLDIHGGDVAGGFRIDVDHVRRFHLSDHAGGQADIARYGELCLHYRKRHRSREALLFPEAGKHQNHNSRCHGHHRSTRNYLFYHILRTSVPVSSVPPLPGHPAEGADTP